MPHRLIRHLYKVSIDLDQYRKFKKLIKMRINAYFMAFSVVTAQMPIEYTKNSQNFDTAELLPMISYIPRGYNHAGLVNHDLELHGF